MRIPVAVSLWAICWTDILSEDMTVMEYHILAVGEILSSHTECRKSQEYACGSQHTPIYHSYGRTEETAYE